MAVKATDQITLAVGVDVSSVDNYYKLQASSANPPTKPTTANPTGWSTTEPTYDGTTTNTLYICTKTTLTDNTFYWSAVSVSSSYEAAKQAANLANAANTLATAINNYFWHDSAGAHVGTVEGEAHTSTAGYNMTLGATNSNVGIVLEHNADILASFTAQALQFYANGLLSASYNSNGALLYAVVNALSAVVAAFTASGVSFYDGNGVTDDNIVAAFTNSGAQIGSSNNSHLELTSNNMYFRDYNGRYLFTANVVNDIETGLATINMRPRPTLINGTNKTFPTSNKINSIISAIDETDESTFTATMVDSYTISLDRAPASGHTIVITYDTLDPVYNFGLGTRMNGKPFGTYSVVLGNNNAASGFASAAIGLANEAKYNNAIAIGRGLLASSPNQIVIGKYNVENDDETQIFIIGSGSDSSHRATSVAVKNNGDVDCFTTLNLTKTADAEATADNGPALIVGPRSGAHIEIDQNEIIAKATATTGGTLYVGATNSGETHVNGTNVNLNPTTNVKIGNGYVFRTKSTTIAIGNVSANASWVKYATPAAISGYTPIAIAGWNQTHNQAGTVGCVSLNSTNNQITVSGKNTSGSAWSGTNNIVVRCLYINNKLLYLDG